MKQKHKDLKMRLNSEEICNGCPKEFVSMLDYAKCLSFEEGPDYPGLIKKIKKLAEENNYDLLDGVYDWNIRAIMI